MEQRVRSLLDARQYAERMGRLKAEVAQLERDRVLYAQEPAAYRAASGAITLIYQRSLAIAVTTSSKLRYGQGLLSGEQSEMSSGGNGSSLAIHGIRSRMQVSRHRS